MDAIQKVDLDIRSDRRQAMEGVDLAWRSHAKGSQEQLPVEPADAAALGPGVADALSEGQARRSNTYAKFDIQVDSGEVVVKIIDGQTGELIRTVPPDELARCIARGEDWAQQFRIYM